MGPVKTEVKSNSVYAPPMSIGIDLVYIPEFENALQEKGSSFFESTFTEWEIAKSQTKPMDQRASFFSARYAAKEAVVKALDGSRLHLDPAIRLNYKEIEVRSDDSGRPFLRFYGEIQSYVQSLNLSSIRISITHSKDYAMSEVLVVY